MLDRVRGEFVDIIEWLDDTRDTVVWRYPRYRNEIKMGARLVVRESQVAVFVTEGTIADVLLPGMYLLHADNVPVLSTLAGWKYGFESPNKAEVYFVNTRQFTDLKWGTQNPVIVRDPEFGMVRLRAHGAYAMRVVDPGTFLAELVGTDPQFVTADVGEYLRQLIVSRLTSALATVQVSVLDLAAHQRAIGSGLAGELTEQLAAVGLAIPSVVINNISVPPEVERALDKRTQLGIVGDLDRYTRFQTANAIEDAARNPGPPGLGAGLGVGMAFGRQVADAAGAYPAGPPPLPPQWYVGSDGRQLGPFDPAALATQVSVGVLTRATLVWRPGMAGWAPAGEVPELARLLSATPPPMPR